MTTELSIVFDLDGTLVDSARDLADSANELVIGLGGRSLETTDVLGMVGEGAALLVRRALTASGLDPETPSALPRFLKIYDGRLLNHTRPYAGMVDALDFAATRARLSVLTNKPIGPTQIILQRLDLARYFDTVLGGDGPFPRKPDPTALRVLMKKAGDRPTMVVGDSPIDAKTAIAGGSAFVWARYGFGAGRFDGQAPDTEYVLDRPGDLVDVIERFARVSLRA